MCVPTGCILMEINVNYVMINAKHASKVQLTVQGALKEEKVMKVNAYKLVPLILLTKVPIVSNVILNAMGVLEVRIIVRSVMMGM